MLVKSGRFARLWRSQEVQAQRLRVCCVRAGQGESTSDSSASEEVGTRIGDHERLHAAGGAQAG